MKKIKIEEKIAGKLMLEGAGVKLRRYIGVDKTHQYEPLLLLDFFDSDKAEEFMAGFPEHPHRGFETITYVIDGQIAHRDNQGHQGLIGAGDVQWMTAGRGILHSEMPQSTKGLTGLQLWLNLPASAKGVPPRYQEYAAAELPIEQLHSGGFIKVIAGKTDQGTRSPINGIATEAIFLDLNLVEQEPIQQSIPLSHQSILLVLTGQVTIEGLQAGAGELAILSKGNFLTIKGDQRHNRCLLIAAKKLKEPIAWLGPFVMNTREEVLQAVDDYQHNRF